MRFILFFHLSTVRYNYRVETPLFLLCSKSKKKLSLRIFPRTATLWKQLPRGCSPDSINLCFLKSNIQLYSSFLSSLYSLPTTLFIIATLTVTFYLVWFSRHALGDFFLNLKSFFYLHLLMSLFFTDHIYFYFTPPHTPLLKFSRIFHSVLFKCTQPFFFFQFILSSFLSPPSTFSFSSSFGFDIRILPFSTLFFTFYFRCTSFFFTSLFTQSTTSSRSSSTLSPTPTLSFFNLWFLVILPLQHDNYYHIYTFPIIHGIVWLSIFHSSSDILMANVMSVNNKHIESIEKNAFPFMQNEQEKQNNVSIKQRFYDSRSQGDGGNKVDVIAIWRILIVDIGTRTGSILSALQITFIIIGIR